MAAKWPWAVMKPDEFRWYDKSKAKKAANSARAWAALNKRRLSVEPLTCGSVIITVRAGLTWRAGHGLTCGKRRKY